VNHIAYNESVRKGYLWLIICLTLLLSLAFGQAPVFAQEGSDQEGDPKYFPETGHWVTGDFLRTYQEVSDPEKIYGYPITEAFQDQALGRIVQYFQKSRFELYSDSPPELKVRLSPLGVLLYTPGEPLPIPDNFPACRTIPETNHQVCYAFLDFFDKNGGAAQFGYPISNFEIHDGRIVQYFQRARLEWHPELPTGQRVVLGDLGRIYFDTQHENPARLLPAPIQDNRLLEVLSLQTHAFPKKAVLPLSGQQTFFIIVQDQNLQPVSDAQVKLVITLPSGEEQRITVPTLTDKDGIATIDFNSKSRSPGIAKIKVEVSYDNLETETTTSYRIWW
jgi:hypothetical protein